MKFMFATVYIWIRPNAIVRCVYKKYINYLLIIFFEHNSFMVRSPIEARLLTLLTSLER